METKPLRIVFAGTPAFAAASLDALLNTPHQLVGVYTQPDRPSGRGKKLTPSAVKLRAIEAGLTVFQPQSLKTPEAQAELAALEPDLMVVVAYGLLLPKAVLDIPRLGCINVHASLLPRWRGAAPIERALLAGDEETGITIMQMDEGLDTGDMLLKKRCPIAADDTSHKLHERLMGLGAEALDEALENIALGRAVPEPQDETRACYAAKLTKAEGALDWALPAAELDRRIRGLNPRPVAFSDLNGERVRIWDAFLTKESSERPPGELICAEKEGLKVATGSGVLVITRMQLPGKKQLPVADLLNARQDLFRAGNRFESVTA
ncbi:methionyl-tRNA formyltransferase [Motiliproteus sp. SC1-56]|uniref:methionyl-tRNA formyltransferase n=1 Tax=Motiliproteus sp. SC1-56 TaxID=2799565 RepID=UPI001A8FFCD8|nr:methionyl-tRNA formyltransferase [Motiliproteus sp. SC1-56]